MTANAIVAAGLWKAGLIGREGETTDFLGKLVHPVDVGQGALGPGLIAGGVYVLCGKLSRQIANQAVRQEP
jgi:hypothetical protein